MLPPAAAVIISFAAMGWAGVPLGVATSMFAGVTIGVGVDFAIHLLARFRRSRDSGLAPNEAVCDAGVATGPAKQWEEFLHPLKHTPLPHRLVTG